MGLLSKAKSSKAKSTSTKQKGTVWAVKNTKEVDEAIGKLVELNAQKKAIEAKMKLEKLTVSKFAEQHFISEFATTGVKPQPPMKVQNSDGQQVTYVVQDRSATATLNDDQVEALEGLLGSDAVEDVVGTEARISFNRVAMSNPDVFKEVEKALTTVANKLVKAGHIEDPLDLIDYEESVHLKPGVVDRAAQIVGSDTTKLKEFFDIVGGSVVKYVKV